MGKMETIEADVAELTGEELVKLRAFIEELEEQRFDDQIERDAKAGKLDHLIAEALEDDKAGRVRDL